MFPKLCSLFNFMTLLLSLTENNFSISFCAATQHERERVWRGRSGGVLIYFPSLHKLMH